MYSRNLWLILMTTLVTGGGSFTSHRLPRPWTTTRLQYIQQCRQTRLWQTRMGDPLRAATGIRPSLHPLTINGIAAVLKERAKQTLPRLSDSGVEPLQVALAAGKIASQAVAARQASSTADGMTLTAEEEQTVAGRIIGVAMRLDDLERGLHEKCQQHSWIAKYDEWSIFGVLEDEPSSSDAAMDARVLDDPLFVLNRAECLLALFLATVEAPELEAKNVTVPCRQIDFLDEDRRDVLLS